MIVGPALMYGSAPWDLCQLTSVIALLKPHIGNREGFITNLATANNGRSRFSESDQCKSSFMVLQALLGCAILLEAISAIPTSSLQAGKPVMEFGAWTALPVLFSLDRCPLSPQLFPFPTIPGAKR